MLDLIKRCRSAGLVVAELCLGKTGQKFVLILRAADSHPVSKFSLLAVDPHDVSLHLQEQNWREGSVDFNWSTEVGTPAPSTSLCWQEFGSFNRESHVGNSSASCIMAKPSFRFLFLLQISNPGCGQRCESYGMSQRALGPWRTASGLRWFGWLDPTQDGTHLLSLCLFKLPVYLCKLLWLFVEGGNGVENT